MEHNFNDWLKTEVELPEWLNHNRTYSLPRRVLIEEEIEVTIIILKLCTVRLSICNGANHLSAFEFIGVQRQFSSYLLAAPNPRPQCPEAAHRSH